MHAWLPTRDTQPTLSILSRLSVVAGARGVGVGWGGVGWGGGEGVEWRLYRREMGGVVMRGGVGVGWEGAGRSGV